MRFISSGRVINICAILVLLICTTEATARIDAAVDTTYSLIGISKSLVTNSLRGGRTLSGSTITTPNCDAIRITSYPAELQLFYTYSVEFNDDLLLNDMERAIAIAVALELDMCDVDGRPVYKVKTDTKHSFSKSGRC